MSVRRGPRKADHFTILDNAALGDERLSFRARGILAYILSKPADWRTNSESLARVAKEGRDAVRTALRELREFGYMVTERIQDPATGQFCTISTVYELPVEPDQSPVPPKPGKRASGNPSLGKTGANQRTDHKGLKQTTTKSSTTAPAASAQPSRPVVVGKSSDERLSELAAACHEKGLLARWDAIGAEKADAIAALVEVHGVQALADHALKMHTPVNPTRFAGGYLGIWQSMPAPRAAAPAKCGECDEYGWRGEDSEGRPIRCSCRRTPAMAAA